MAFAFSFGAQSPAMNAEMQARLAAAGLGNSSSTPSLPAMPAKTGGAVSFGGGFGAAASRTQDAQKVQTLEKQLADANAKIAQKNTSLVSCLQCQVGVTRFAEMSSILHVAPRLL